MGFLSGSVSCLRFKVDGDAPTFGVPFIESLQENSIGKQKVASEDGSECGWTAGDSILDTSFDLAKNVVNDCLHIAIRIDQHKPPGALFKAYYLADLKVLAANNPSGYPTSKQKKAAKESARERLDQEAKDGRFLRRRTVPVMWDSRNNVLLVGSSSISTLQRLDALFHSTFQRSFKIVSAENLADKLVEGAISFETITPTQFCGSSDAETEIEWSPGTDKNFLGNEFLLWLWWRLAVESNDLTLRDGSVASIMLSKSLSLQCPRGQSGKETLTSEGPSKLPEAICAIRSGKLPRKTGLIINRNNIDYSLAIHAELLGVSGAKLPKSEVEGARARIEERIDNIRYLFETIDLIYEAFLLRRLTDAWAVDAEEVKVWLQQ